MTKVNCTVLDCESNEDGLCSEDEITVFDVFGEATCEELSKRSDNG